jgi:hypothetical protein
MVFSDAFSEIIEILIQSGLNTEAGVIVMKRKGPEFIQASGTLTPCLCSPWVGFSRSVPS